MDRLARGWSSRVPRSMFGSHEKQRIIFTHNSVSQNNRQLTHFFSSSRLVDLEFSVRRFGVFVDVTTSVNCIKLIDQAVNIK